MKKKKKPFFSFLFFSFVFFSFDNISRAQNSTANSSSCPLDFTVLEKFISAAKSSPSSSFPTDPQTLCAYSLQGLHLVQSQFLLTTSLFVPPISTDVACWTSFTAAVSSLLPPGFSPLSSCGFDPSWLSLGCMNITSRADFEALVPSTAIADMETNCNQSLQATPACTACTTSLNRVKASYLVGVGNNVSSCAAFPFIYAGADVNRFGPTDNATALCLFLLNATMSSSSPSGGSSSSSSSWVIGVIAGAVAVAILIMMALFWVLRKRRRRGRRSSSVKLDGSQALAAIEASASLVKFAFEEIKEATSNFSRENIIGRGGFGNVYKGVLKDGSEVAVKRFKNCSAAGDASFAHEVEVIASVRHVNLLALRGYCIATTQMEGHQRIIVCDLAQNGSLHDHLFGSAADLRGCRLSWPVRQRIVVGMARALAYLHYGAQPTIIHRDVKASNILLDGRLEAKVADFGLARFAPEGMTHVSTRVAGTLGYVAPEYALYGQLTEKSDVYSFGVVLLELLSGRKALVSAAGDSGGGSNTITLITDWAWSLVRQGKPLEVIEEGMEELGAKEVMEKYVLVGVLASHPLLQARPRMDQIVTILETDLSVPTIPDRPIPLTADMEDIERSVGSSSGSGQLSSFSGYQPFTIGTEDSLLNSKFK